MKPYQDLLPGSQPAEMQEMFPSRLDEVQQQNQRPHQNEEGVFNYPVEVHPTKCIQGVARIAGAKINYTYEIPDESTDHVPLVILPGFGGVKPAYNKLRRAIASRGKPTVTYRPPRSQKKFAAMHPLHVTNPSRIQSQAAWAVMRSLQKTFGHDEFDLSCHSRGGQIGADFALHKPEAVRSMIFVASTGLDGHNFSVMARRIPKFLGKELLPALPRLSLEGEPRIVIDGLHYFLRNPIRTLGEGISVSNCDIRQAIKKIGKLGIKTAAIQFNNDSFFPIEGVQSGCDKLFDTFMIYPDKQAGHITPQLDAERLANTHMQLFKTLNA